MQGHRYARYVLATIWIGNGLFCKVLDLVPRHQLIVARILGAPHARILTIMIGVLEVVFAGWIIRGAHWKATAVVQMVVIAVMNVIEFVYASDLLLWGRSNALFAAILIMCIYVEAFLVRGRKTIGT